MAFYERVHAGWSYLTMLSPLGTTELSQGSFLAARTSALSAPGAKSRFRDAFLACDTANVSSRVHRQPKSKLLLNS